MEEIKINDEVVESTEEKQGSMEELDNDINEKEPVSKTYTEEEFKELERNFERKIKENSEKIKLDVEKTKGMTEDEVREYEIEQKETKLKEWEENLKLKDLENKSLNMLAEKELSESYLEFVVDGDIESTEHKIIRLKSLIDEAVSKEIERKLAGKTPSIGVKASKSNDVQKQIENAIRG